MMITLISFTSLILLLFSLRLATGNCPTACECNVDDKMIICAGPLFLTLPDNIPSGFETLVVRNATLRSIAKHSFRKMDKLKEFRAENCEHLNVLEKFAFKAMRKLRVISFSNCPRLTEIQKGAFSGIANQFGLKILFTNTPIQRVHGGAFRYAHNIRELSISGSDMALSRHAFSSITQLDFLTLTGLTLVEPQLFTNSTRFHIVHIKESHFEIPPNAFEDLAHVHQILIQRCHVSSIAPDAFTGISTIETLELFDNTIGMVAARAFSGLVNLGRLRIVRNAIKTMETTESITSQAVQLRFEENTLNCDCDLRWMTGYADSRLVDVNHCGVQGAYRSIRSYLRQQCSSPNQVSRSITAEHSHVINNHERIIETNFSFGINNRMNLLLSVISVLALFFAIKV